jgi:alkyldihydroxyacetonephosphate synthase
VAYGSLIFPNFEAGVAFMHEVAMRDIAPVSVRLVDNMQFQFGQALKPATEGLMKAVVDKIKKWYVLNGLGFQADNMVAATLLFEGEDAAVVRAHNKTLNTVAAKYGGQAAGEENGIRGYFLTYMIAYLRDFGLNYSFIGDSFETSVPYTNVAVLCANVKEKISEICAANNVAAPPFVSCRVTQLYDTGAAVYFYFGILSIGLDDPLDVFQQVEDGAREEILSLGGSLSHHHGIGKLRKRWLEQTLSPTGVTMIRAVKTAIDPTNVFASGNLIDLDPEHPIRPI